MLVDSMIDVLPTSNGLVKSLNNLVSIHITEKEIITNFFAFEEPEVELESYCPKAQEAALRKLNPSRSSIIRLDLPQAVSNDSNKLIEAWNVLCTHHYILRTAIVKDGSGTDVRFQQKIFKRPKHVSANSLEDFDLLSQHPEVACLVMYQSDEVSAVYLYVPYAIADRTSLGYIWKDFLRILAGRSLPSRLNFSEYCKHASHRRHDEAKHFWSQAFEGIPALTIHSIPHERHHTKQTTELDNSFTVSAFSIKRLSKALGVSVEALIYTAFGIMLDRHSQASSGAVVFAVEGRDKTVADHDTVLGYADQEYPLKLRFDPRESVTRAIRETDHFDTQASSNAFIGYDELEHAHEAVTGNFKVNINEDDTSVPIDDRFAVCFDVKLGRSVSIAARHDTTISQEKMKVLLSHFMAAIVNIVSNPNLSVSQINIISPDEHSHILEMGKPVSHPVHDNVHKLFERQVELTPDAPAIQFEAAMAISYDELNRVANRVARQLPVGRGSFVPVCLKRSTNLIISLLAILKTGAAYVTMDPDTPHDRNRFIVDDVAAKIVVVDKSTAGRFQNEVIIEDIIETSRLNEDANISYCCEPSDPVYVIYTSGSTGKPKGVLHKHSSATSGLAAFPTLPDLRQLLFHNPVFSAAQRSIWSTLKQGGCLCLASKDNLTIHIGRTINQMQVNVIDVTPSTALLLTPGTIPCLRRMTVAGELINPALIPLWVDKLELLNAYGLSENTQVNWRHEMVLGQNPQKIGRPSDTTTSFVLNPGTTELTPLLIPGELCLGGDQLATHYINRPEKTAESFISNPFGPGRLYRTGDMVIAHEDGSIEMIGRIDFQVKINDQRVEPGDSNAIIQTHPGVLNSSVVAISLDGKNALVAVIVPKIKEYEWTKLRNELKYLLKQHIPNYMRPAYWLLEEALPLNVNGKVDIPQLVKRVQGLGRQYLLQSSTENYLHGDQFNGPAEGGVVHGVKLTAIIAEILGLPYLSLSTMNTFQELGGSSLDAIRVSSKAFDAGIEIGISEILQTPLQDLFNKAEYSGRSLAETSVEPFSLLLSGTELDRAGIEDAYPTTSLQDTFLADSLLGNTTYVYRRYYRVKHHSSKDLRDGLEKLLTQVPLLRTTFMSNKTSFLQVMRKAAPLTWENLDMTADEFSSMDKPNMDLGDNFVHFTYLRDGILAVTMHHALFDFWSHDFLLDDLSALLQQKPLQVRLSPAHFVRYLRQQDEDELRGFWKEKLQNAYPCTLGQATTAVGVVHAEISENVQAFCSANNVSVGSLIYAAWAIVLSLHTNQGDLIFGTIFSGRDAPVPGVLQMAYPTVTTAPFRIQVNPDILLLDLIRATQANMLECASRAQFGLRNILKSSGHDAALFDTLVNILVKENEADLQKHSDVFERCAPFEPNYLGYTMLEAEPGARGLDLRIVSSLPREKASFLLRNVVETINAILHDSTMYIGELCPTSAEEKAFLDSLSTEQPTEPNMLAHSLFGRMVARNPEKVALEDLSGNKMSYGDLDARANHLARKLQEVGVQKGDVIPIGMEKSMHTLVAVFGVLKAGAAFAPLDPKNPKDRNGFIMQDVEARVAITDSIHSGIFDGFSGEVIKVDAMETDNSKIAATPNLSPEDPAYIIYTSGSTGLPKGVQVSHRAVAASAEGMIEACQVDSDWHVLWFLNYVFDASYFDVFTVLGSGGTISIADQDTMIGDLASCINNFGVKQLMLTPTISKLISPSDVPSVKTLLVCGEPITSEVVDTWASRIELYNGYGPTEATILMTVSRVTQGGNLKSIGYPLKAVKASILHPKRLTPVPFGAVGELCVSGAQVATGYLNRPEITAASFQRAKDGSVIYRTGDYARWLPSGEIECLGRKDNQVKLNGFRIELGEIENAFLSHAGDLIQSCVVGVSYVQRKKQIVAYYMPRESPSLAEEDEGEGGLMYSTAVISPSMMTESLRGLAHYMIPKVFLPFRSFPLLPSGKVDRKTLSTMAEKLSPRDLSRYSETTNTQQADSSAELSDMETVLREAWASLFDVSPRSISPSDLFYNYGGDSIVAINLVSMLRRQGYSLSVNDVVTYPSLRDQALRVSPIKAMATRAIDFVVHASVHRRLRDAGVAAEDIEDIYPCAPGQVEFLTQGHTDEQFWQLMTTRSVPQGFDLEAWISLTRKLTEANQILRAMYLKQDESDPLSWVQVVLKEPVLDMAILECQPDEKPALIRHHWERRFEIGRPFVRYLVLKYPDGTMDLCTKLDHAMYDGTLLRIFDDQFAALRDGHPLPQPTPFKAFINHTQQQGRTEMLSFWKENLEGANFAYPTHVTNPRVSDSVTAIVDVPVNAFAQMAGVTVSIVFQTAYSLLLSKLSGSADVTYDYLLTGRNVDIDEPQLINGTCANFLPFRSRVDTDSTSIPALLKDTQSRFWRMTENGSVGLGNIYRALGADRATCASKTLFLFQPFEPAVGEQDHMRWIVMAMSKVTMFINYAIMFEVFKDASGHKLKMGYDERAFGRAEAENILALYVHIVTKMVAGRPLGVSER